MEKTGVKIGVTLFVIAGMSGAVIVGSPRVRDDLSWYWTLINNNSGGYVEYIESLPSGRHIAEAEKLYDDKSWEEARELNTVDGYQVYLREHSNGKYLTQAMSGIDDLHWKDAFTAYTEAAIINYLKTHPDGNYADEARANILALQSAMSQYSRSITGTVGKIDKSARTLEIRTAMGKTEVLRLTDDTKIWKKGTKRQIDDLSFSEGLQIDYVNLPKGMLLAKSISMAYSVINCSCGSSCSCPLSRGCRTIRY